MITVRRICPDDASLLREIRLRALSDSPGAFGSTYARELAFNAAEWESRARLRSTSTDDATFLAFDGPQCRGIIGCFIESSEPTMATVVSMWVAPEARRNGIGDCLVRAAEEWARQRGLTHLFLNVVENNAPAMAFYQKCGFVFTGETDQYPNNPNLKELFMLKPL